MKPSDIFRPHHFILIAIMVIATGAGFLTIPAQVELPVHWNIYGQPDLYLSRTFALALIPGISVVELFVAALALRLMNDDRLENGKHVLRAAFTATLLIFCAVQIGLVLIGSGHEIEMIRLVTFAVACLLSMLGNVLPKSQPNAAAGIRLPWTLSNSSVWQFAHRIAGKLMLQAGVVLAIAAVFLPNVSVLIGLMIICIVLPIVAASFASYQMAKRLPREG